MGVIPNNIGTGPANRKYYVTCMIRRPKTWVLQILLNIDDLPSNYHTTCDIRPEIGLRGGGRGKKGFQKKKATKKGSSSKIPGKKPKLRGNQNRGDPISVFDCPPAGGHLPIQGGICPPGFEPQK